MRCFRKERKEVVKKRFTEGQGKGKKEEGIMEEKMHISFEERKEEKTRRSGGILKRFKTGGRKEVKER